MVAKRSLTCAKCGIHSRDYPALIFHRFPLPSMHGPLKAIVWARYCYPDNDWVSEQSLYHLYKQHKVLCGKHFDDSSYTSSERNRLNKFAIPFEAQNILAQVRDELRQNSAVDTQETPVEVKEACRICLAFNVKMYNLEQYNLGQMLQKITGIVARDNERMFQHLCWECAARLSAASAFREKALQSDEMLQRILSTVDIITESDITLLKANHDILKPSLTIQEVFYTADIGESDPNNMNPDNMEVNDDVLHNNYDISHNNDDISHNNDDTTHNNYDTNEQIVTEESVEIDEFILENLNSIQDMNSTHEELNNLCCDDNDNETIGNLILNTSTERSKLNGDGSITLINTNINKENDDFNDNVDLVLEVETLEQNKNDTTTLDGKSSSDDHHTRSTTKELDRKIIERFKELKFCEMTMLAKEFGVTPRVVRRILSNAGLKASKIKKTVKEKSSKKNPVLRIEGDKKNQIISLKQDGVPVSKIMSQLGVSRSTIYLVWRRWCENNVNNKILDNKNKIQQEINTTVHDFSDQDLQMPTVLISQGIG